MPEAPPSTEPTATSAGLAESSANQPREPVVDRTFPEQRRLKTPPEFRRVFDGGRKVVGRHFVMFSLVTDHSGPRLGLAVSRRVGNAVTRNRLKRQIRESFRHHQHQLGNRDLVVIARGSASQAGSASLQRDLARCWGKIGDG